MEQPDLIAEAINLTMFGMGFVFLFLTLLVFITKLMSIIIQKMSKQVQDDDTHHDDNLSLKDELDEETKFVIEQAIKLHRGA
ncbi:OadG family protein [Candidatus Thioglobus sp.]|jgi:Na+-transporting methylmalonyl-CoA/oxaloacetate decarboxylase, gamma subunit|uniref:OadG family protein n=1 Tax=Candidatus Thioglobus sp. TaxID=2026721 RepID=UPI0032422EF7